MYEHNRSRQDKAVKLCSGGSPSMRRHRFDGGAAAASAGDGNPTMGNIASAPAAPPPVAPPIDDGAMKAKPGENEVINGVKPTEPVNPVRPLNSSATDKLGVTP